MLVPPPPMLASLAALVITVSRGLRRRSTTACSNGITSADGFTRSTAAATRAATSTQRTLVVDPLRHPVTGPASAPETSGSTYTLPSIAGTLERACSIASWRASRTSRGTSSSAAAW